MNLPDLADVSVLSFVDQYETYAFIADGTVLALLRHAPDGTFLVCNEYKNPYGMWGFMNSGLDKWFRRQFPSLKSWHNHRNCIYCSMDDNDLSILNLKAERITRREWVKWENR